MLLIACCKLFNRKMVCKTMLIMNLTAIFLLVACLNVSANGYGQRVNLSEKDASLETVFKQIKKQTGYTFVYRDYLLRKAPKITINIYNVTVEQALDACLQNQQLGFTIVNKIIVIKEKTAVQNEVVMQPPPPVEINGKITNDKGEPLAGATVKEKGTNNSVSSKEDGSFSIITSTTNAVLVFTYIGYDSKEIKTGKATEISIQLVQKVNSLNDVVVIGYGTSRKKDITGSVGSVSVKDQDKTAVIATEQLLQGQVSGVQVTQAQSQPGGAVFSIRIRGTNSINSSNEPLFVVDGYAGADIGSINPSDIAAMEVLKDASATAIYGSRGANGVVIISTKRGKYAGNNVSFNANYGTQKVSKRYDMMNASQYGTYLNTVQNELNAINGTTQPLPYTDSEIKAFGKGTDWQNEIFRAAPVSNLTLAFNGGDEKSRHYLSFNYFDQKGVIIGSDYKRGIVRFNLDKNVSKKLLFSFSSQISYDNQNATTVNTYGSSNVASVLWDAVRFNPIVPVRNTSGAYTYINSPLPYVEPLGNPVAYANTAQDVTYNFKSFVNTFGEYEIIKGLKLKSSFGVNYNNGGSKYFLPSALLVGASNSGEANQRSIQNYDWLSENTIAYNKDYTNQSFNIIGGFSFQKSNNNYFGSFVNTLVTDNLGADNLGIGNNSISQSNFVQNTLASYYARANYQLFNKYLFTATIRADGSSRFGENNKWGYFPSGAVAWRMSEEKFIQSIKAISDLKLRVSYGVTGNQEIGNFNTLSTFSNNGLFNSSTNYSLGQIPSLVVGLASDRIANPNLKWESTASSNIGLDLGLFNNRISFTADYYYKKTSNLLFFLGIPQTSGFSSILSNIGSVQNKGFELALTTVNISTPKFNWTTRLNFSKNTNKILDMGGNDNLYVGELSNSIFVSGSTKSAILQVGQPIGSFFGYQFDGIWQTQDQITASGTKQSVLPGDPIYRDINGDNLLDDNDRIILGNANPKFIYSINNDFSYKGLTLTMFWLGIQGNKVLNVNRYEIESGNTGFNKLANVATGSWTGPNTSNTLPRASSTLRRGTGVTSDVLEDGSFLRLKTVNLSYDILSNHKAKVFKSAVVYLTAQNLVTFSKYSGYDPEVNSFSTREALSLGTDYNAYPNYRTYIVGVKFGF